MFPIHVHKFYWLFHRYVNPKIKQLKWSINELHSQNNSITSESSSLEITIESIEKLSSKIKSNVDELNNTITSQDKFNCLVNCVGNQICSRFKQVREKVCEEVKSFEERLRQMARDSRGRILYEVAFFGDKIEKHVQSTKNQLVRYINKTNELNSYLIDRGNLIHYLSYCLVKVPSILYKLEKLKHTEWELEDSVIVAHDVPFGGGLENHFKRFKGQLNSFLFRKIFGLDSIRGRIKNLMVFLNDVLCLDEANDIIHKNSSFEFEAGDGRRYEQELNSIRQSTLKAFALAEKISELRMKIRLIRPFSDFFKEIRKLKSHMEPIRKYITPRLLSFIDNLEYVRIEKDDIVEFIKGMDNGIQKTIKKLHNTQKIVKFLEAVDLKLKALRNVPQPKCEGIEEYISVLSNWIVTARRTFTTVSKEYRKNIAQILQTDRHDEIRSGPLRIKEYIREVLPELIKHVEQKITLLKTVSEIKKNLDVIKSAGEQLSSVNNTGQTSDVEKGLEYLKCVNEKLSEVHQSIESNITLIQGAHGRIKNKNGGKLQGSGVNIQSHVVSIGQIPGKIAELQSKVKYNKVLLNIAKSVNETLEDVKEKANKLGSIEYSLEYIEPYIGFVKKRYEKMSRIIGFLGCFKISIALPNIKGYVVFPEQIVLKNDIGIKVTHILITLISHLTCV